MQSDWYSVYDYMCNKFGVDSSSRFSVRAQTDVYTQTDATEHAVIN